MICLQVQERKMGIVLEEKKRSVVAVHLQHHGVSQPDELMFCPEKGSALLPEHTFVSGDDECPLISLAKIKRSSFFYQPNPLQIIQQFFLQPGSAQAGLALEQGGSLPLLWG